MLRGLLILLALPAAPAAGPSLLDVLARPLARWPRHAPPRYMLDLYRSVAAPDGLTLSATPHQANVVRCFADRESRQRSHFLFNLSADKSDKLLEAEFHVFKAKPRAKDRRKAKLLQSELLELKMYQLLPSSKTKRKRKRKLLESRRVSVDSTGWEIFSVKEAVAEWIKDENSNLGLQLSVRSLANETVPKGLVRFSKGNHNDRQPLLVLFLDDSRQTVGTFSSPTSNHDIPVSPTLPPPPDLSRTKRFDSVLSSNSSCSRHDLYIDFERIGWAAWIISPKGYNAYQCRGGCYFPLGQNQRPTNHATVQSIAHELGLAHATQLPSCVPDRLLSISLLYFDEHGNVILKQYDDMVAAGCGCH